MKRHTIITISRQYGSGGHIIGKMVADQLNIPFYDRELIALTAKDTGFDTAVLESADEQATHSLLYTLSMGLATHTVGGGSGMSLNDQIFISQSKVIKRVAAKGSCVIVGRCADYVLQENPDVVNVFIHADFDLRVKRAIELYGQPPEKAAGIVQKTDKRRALYRDYYTGLKWDRAEQYMISLDSGRIGLENAVSIIVQFAQMYSERTGK